MSPIQTGLASRFALTVPRFVLRLALHFKNQDLTPPTLYVHTRDDRVDPSIENRAVKAGGDPRPDIAETQPCPNVHRGLSLAGLSYNA